MSLKYKTGESKMLNITGKINTILARLRNLIKSLDGQNVLVVHKSFTKFFSKNVNKFAKSVVYIYEGQNSLTYPFLFNIFLFGSLALIRLPLRKSNIAVTSKYLPTKNLELF